MSKLYSQLAKAYHEMYQSIFDYKKEFDFYDKLLKKYKCRKILEIGCGTGNLAKYFMETGYNYTGLDLFNEMLKIAKKVEPRAKFVQGDMRALNLSEKFDAVLITGRSFTYMTTNKDVMDALNSVNRVLAEKGILIFDNFDAEAIFSNFKKRLVHTAKYNGRTYKRVSKNTMNLQTGWTKNWEATYYITENGKTRIVKDKSILRSFTKDELKLFLKLAKFELLQTTQEGSSFVTIARK